MIRKLGICISAIDVSYRSGGLLTIHFPDALPTEAHVVASLHHTGDHAIARARLSTRAISHFFLPLPRTDAHRHPGRLAARVQLAPAQLPAAGDQQGARVVLRNIAGDMHADASPPALAST